MVFSFAQNPSSYAGVFVVFAEVSSQSVSSAKKAVNTSYSQFNNRIFRRIFSSSLLYFYELDAA